jgi:hypothetical protein
MVHWKTNLNCAIKCQTWIHDNKKTRLTIKFKLKPQLTNNKTDAH